MSHFFPSQVTHGAVTSPPTGAAPDVDPRSSSTAAQTLRLTNPFRSSDSQRPYRHHSLPINSGGHDGYQSMYEILFTF